MTPEKLTNPTIELHLMDLVAVQSKNGKFGFCFTEKAGASRNESVTEFKFNTHLTKSAKTGLSAWKVCKPRESP